ncbi:MAG: TMEM14 family protein [Chthoniobacterales bacterium]
MNYLSLATIFYFIFATLTQVGGVIGFIKAKSRASLIAGLISGALLDLAGIMLVVRPERPQIGLGLGLVVTLLLLGRFAPAFFRTKKFMPAGMIFFLGLISLALTIAAFI